MRPESPLFGDPMTRSPLLRLVAFLAVGGLAVGFAVEPQRAWAALYCAALLTLSISLFGTVFIALANVCSGSWHVAFRRVPEALSSGIAPFGAVVVALLAWRTLAGPTAWHPPDEPGTLWFKAWWLQPTFVVARSVVYVVVWMIGASWLRSVSHAEDSQDSPLSIPRLQRGSAVFAAVFAITFSLAAADWLMALEPMWYSTVWGVYWFSGLMTAGLATLILLALALRDAGPLRQAFTDEHLHDLGKLLIGFCCFWMYIWYCQYMLIWYAHIPEETVYFVPRLTGAWSAGFITNVVLNWGLPFLLLLPRSSKRNPILLRRVAVVVLVGRAVDLYLAVYPAAVGPRLVMGVPEVAAACVMGVAGWSIWSRSFAAVPAVPAGSALLRESLEYHA